VRVVSVHRSPGHTFSKPAEPQITLLAGLGVEGDAHAGTTVKHRSRVARNPLEPNLRQVHLIHVELIDELNGLGYDVAPGQLGENITTSGIDLLGLPTGALLQLGEAVIEVTGLRNPCYQIDDFRQGVLAEVVGRDERGAVVRRAGVMAVVRTGGVVRPGQEIALVLPEPPHRALQTV
jgi:MOSC domain-containing protein YiiM